MIVQPRMDLGVAVEIPMTIKATKSRARQPDDPNKPPAKRRKPAKKEVIEPAGA